MKKLLTLIVFAVCGLQLSGCVTQFKSNTIRTETIEAKILPMPVVAEMRVEKQKVTGKASGIVVGKSKNGQVTEKDLVSQAVAKALGQDPPSPDGPDLLVDANFFWEREEEKVTVTVTGYPGYYTTFRNVKDTDSLWLNVVKPGSYRADGGR